MVSYVSNSLTFQKIHNHICINRENITQDPTTRPARRLLSCGAATELLLGMCLQNVLGIISSEEQLCISCRRVMLCCAAVKSPSHLHLEEQVTVWKLFISHQQLQLQS